MGFWERVSTGLGLLEQNEEHQAKLKQLNSRIPVEKALRKNKIAICKPREFRDIVRFVNKLRENIPIIVNFTLLQTDIERSLDFVCGAVCALDGVLERIGDGIYFYAPPDMRVES